MGEKNCQWNCIFIPNFPRFLKGFADFSAPLAFTTSCLYTRVLILSVNNSFLTKGYQDISSLLAVKRFTFQIKMQVAKSKFMRTSLKKNNSQKGKNNSVRSIRFDVNDMCILPLSPQIYITVLQKIKIKMDKP